MPNIYTESVTELTGKLNLEPELSAFLDKAYINSIPRMIQRDDDEYRYNALLVPSFQEKKDYPSSDGIEWEMSGTLFLAIRSNSTGQVALEKQPFKMSLDHYLNPTNDSWKDIIGSLQRINFNNSLTGNTKRTHRKHSIQEKELIDDLSLRTILYHSADTAF
ncbi:MAG: hypothetical protein HAW67_06000, partial [Endozoicomonadaceae bacterium]|nr:hypothetical protein [Endozoicomonadaceae bacterium]